MQHYQSREISRVAAWRKLPIFKEKQWTIASFISSLISTPVINSWTHRIARSTRYSSPINSRCPPRLFCVLSAMKALRANSRLVISLAICNFPLSPNGLAIEICRMNVLITYFTIDVTLRSSQNLSQNLKSSYRTKLVHSHRRYTWP